MSNDFDLSWLALEKYDEQAKFSGMDWFIQLHFRYCIKGLGEKHPDLVQKYIDLIKENPIIKSKNHKDLNSPVRDANYIDLLMANDRNPKIREFYNLSAKEIDEIAESAIAPNTNNEWAIHKPILAIDLDASDEQLLLCFKRWIQEQRIKSGHKPKSKMFTTNDYKKWISNMVLPYLDITLILDFDGNDLPYHFIGNSLFPDEIEIDVTDKVRRTVKPLANSLLEIDNLSVLRAQQDNRHKIL